MNYRYISDSHSHSNFSPDAFEAPSALCEKAALLGLYSYTLTDHCECNDYNGEITGFSYKDNSKECFDVMTALSAKFKSKLNFYKGIELGQPLHNLTAAEDVLTRAYDFVLCSVHNIKNHEDFYYMDFSNLPKSETKAILKVYFDEILETVNWGKFDSLAHLTYPLRYICGEHGININLDDYQSKINEIFSLLIEKEKSLEINTSGLRQKIKTTLPSLDLLTQYYKMGGRLVTIGSDAHTVSDLGKGIKEGFETLKLAGFNEFAIYENRKPKLLPLE